MRQAGYNRKCILKTTPFVNGKPFYHYLSTMKDSWNSPSLGINGWDYFCVTMLVIYTRHLYKAICNLYNLYKAFLF